MPASLGRALAQVVRTGNGAPAEGLDAILAAFVSALREEMGEEEDFHTWFGPMRIVEATEDRLVFWAPNNHFVNVAQETYRNAVERAVARAADAHRVPRFEVLFTSSDGEETKEAQPSHCPGLNPAMTFASLVRTRCNDFAIAAAQTVVAQLGRLYNPLIVYGGKGMGKTHLLQAMAQAVFAVGLTPVLRDREQLVNDFTSSVQGRRMADFRMFYRSGDVILLDDLDAAIGKEASILQLLWIIRTYLEQGKQVVMSFKSDPREGNLPEDLREIALRGLLLPLLPPVPEDFEMVLMGVMAGMGVNLPPHMARYAVELAQAPSLGSVGGVAKAIHFYRTLSPLEDWEPLITRAIRPLDQGAFQKSTDETENGRIVHKVAAITGISPTDIRSDSTDRDIIRAKHVAMFLIRQRGGSRGSYPRIGAYFECDQSTARTAILGIGKKMLVDQGLRDLLARLGCPESRT
jgi:chromosomal replication initiator protein